MKKILSIIICLCCVLTLNVPVYAANTEGTLTYDLSSSGNNNITVKKGDVVTVNYSISASETCRTVTTQNQIEYDPKFFELEKGSISKDKSLADVFSTSNPVDSDGSHYVYFNSVSNVIFKADTPTKIGSFKLKVIGESGSSAITNTAFYATNSKTNIFKSAKNDLMVTIKGSPEHTHEAVKQEGLSATEFSAGYKPYYKCTCNKYYEDEDCEKEITDRVAWKSAGGDGYIAAGHKHGKVTKENGVKAEKGKSGYKSYYKCSCGAYFEDEDCTEAIEDFEVWTSKGGNGYIAPLPRNVLAEDSMFSRVLRIVLIVLIAAGICCAVAILKRRKNKE